MPRARLIVLVLAGVAVLVAAGTWFLMDGERADATGWRPSERAAFLRNCVEQCRNAPGVTPDRYPLCDKACACGADEAQKTMTARELDAAAQAMAANTASAEQKAAMDRLQKAGLRCVTDKLPAQK